MTTEIPRNQVATPAPSRPNRQHSGQSSSERWAAAMVWVRQNFAEREHYAATVTALRLKRVGDPVTVEAIRAHRMFARWMGIQEQIETRAAS